MKGSLPLQGWWIRKATQEEEAAERLNKASLDLTPKQEAGWYFADKALSAQETLLNAGVVGEDILLGHTEQYAWIGESDWIYRVEFDAEEGLPCAYLHFKGLDTVTEIYLNGEYFACHDDMFFPLRARCESKLKAHNVLVLHFRAPRRYIDRMRPTFPEEWRDEIEEYSFLRKSPLDYLDFGRVTLIKIGLFDDVCLETPDQCEIVWNDVTFKIGEWYHWADVNSCVHFSGILSDGTVKIELFDPEGNLAGIREEAAQSADENWQYKATIRVQNPRLWWPIGYGEHPLYTLKVTLLQGDKVLDTEEKKVGIRRIEHTGDFRFRVNGRKIKLWGSNFAPFTGFTHRLEASRERCVTQMKMAAMAHMNCIRLWGGGEVYGDYLYDTADELGILIWQEFYLWWGYYPETPHYRELYRKEATHQIKRLKHHPCILLWCAGNEILMCNEQSHWPQDKKEVSYVIFREDYASVCKEMDPDRLYLPTSPSGGDYPGDPTEGDCHPLYYTVRHSLRDYPVFTTEAARSSIGPLRSLRRYLSEEEIWPEGYINYLPYNAYNPYEQSYEDSKQPQFMTEWKKVPLPPTWWKHACGYFGSECAKVEHFFDAHDAESLVYRINAAFAEHIVEEAEMCRRGKPYFDLNGERESQGYLIWKINDTWPQFYCTLVDYFLETHIPYYQVKRSYAPLLLSFDFQNHIYLWGVNDTPEDVRGTIILRSFSPSFNRIEKEMRVPALIRAGESKVLTNLDDLCPIITDNVLYAVMLDENGQEIARSTTLVDIERNQTFQKAKLSLKIEGDELVVTTDKFAHCVELNGSEDGDEFGWFFSDNYFDLLPFEERRVRLYSKHKGGVINAKAHYSPYTATIECPADFAKEL